MAYAEIFYSLLHCRSDMGRSEEAEMPTEFAPTPDPQPDETPERKPASS